MQPAGLAWSTVEPGPTPPRDLRQVAAEVCLVAGEVVQALVVQLLPEGVDSVHYIMGLRQERLGIGDPHVPQARRA